MKRAQMFARIDRRMLSRNRSRRSRAMSVILALIIGAGCRQSSLPNASGTEPRAVAAARDTLLDSTLIRTAPDSEWVQTPAGLMHRSCVHQIPAGATVLSRDTVRRADGSRYVLPRCRYRGRSSLPIELYELPSASSSTPASLPAQPSLVARVVTAGRQRASWPRPYSQLDLEVTIGQTADSDAVVVVGDSIKVYRRRGSGQLMAVTNDSITAGDEIEVWHGGGPDPRGSRLVGRPVYFALQVVVRGSP